MIERPRIGDLFASRYRTEAVLGEGGMGAVYRAVDTQVGDTVALKTLITAADHPAAIERFRREVRLARKITHPNVARIHDLGEHGGMLYLTMEYVRGRDLQRILESEGKLTPPRAIAFLLPVASALAEIHKAGVVHRDLKPANVLVEESGRVVLADFGVARAEEDRSDSVRTAGPIGTPLYMAPEQVTGGAITPRTDLYAFGLLLYELLTNEVPFVEATSLATALARLQRPPPDPRLVAPVPDVIAEVVLACLTIDPAGRPASAADLELALRVADCGKGATLPMQLLKTEAFEPNRRPGTISPGDRALAVLPFQYRGPSEDDYLGDALTEELIDRLSTTRGLRVLAAGATQKFKDDRDPTSVGKALGVDVIVDGTVQTAGGRVRVTARLCDARSGRQLWNERFDGAFADVFELQDRVGKKIAESMRVGLNTTSVSGDLPPEAVENYLRARKKLREARPHTAIELLDQCLAVAPEFGPAHAARAMAAIRAWFLPGSHSTDWQAVAGASVERALACAPGLAETHLAAAMHAMHDARFADAARSTERALDIAPTYPEAHEYLGRLQCETGRTEEGLRRLRLAIDLDPTAGFSWIDLARVERLLGNLEVSKDAMRRAESVFPATHAPIIVSQARFAAWDRDFDTMRRIAAEATAASPAYEFLRIYVFTAIGQVPYDVAIASIDNTVKSFPNSRFRSVALQLSCETLSIGGLIEPALEYLKIAADDCLIDIVWLERCSALDALRSDARFGPIVDQVRARAQSVWT
jgi:serine/threonine-protein kinase